MQLKPQTYPGARSPEVSPREIENRRIARIAAQESIVLLKNEDQMLPLAPGSALAVYGNGAAHTIKGGTGSGEVNERESVSIVDGLTAASFQITSGRWLQDYEALYNRSRQEWKAMVLKEAASESAADLFDAYSAHPYQAPIGRRIDQEDLREAGTDTALYVLSRQAGENKDRYEGPGDYLLSEDEITNLSAIAATFPKVILIVNAGAAVDLTPVEQLPQIKAILFIAQAGMEGGPALASLLSGEVTPSGKLSSTWALRYEDYPNAATFSHCSGDTGSEFYREGIYLGYRYFDTFDRPVRYPFGFGLSYTTFSIQSQSVQADSETVTVTAQVTNTGSASGKEVVQLYAACPQGKLTKEIHHLCAFGKTELLAPGEAQTLALSFPLELLTSYSEASSSYLLEAGLYFLFLGNSSRNLSLIGALNLDEQAITRTVAPICPLQKPLDEITPDPAPLIALAEQWAEERRARSLPVLPLCGKAIPRETISYQKGEALSPTVEKVLQSLTQEEKLHLLTGLHDEEGLSAALGSAGVSVPGAAGETYSVLRDDVQLPAIALADGPAGLRLVKDYSLDDNGIPCRLGIQYTMEGGFFADPEPEEETAQRYYQYCTAFPVGTLLAQSWNEALLTQVGAAVAREMEEFHVTLWLAPGMNLQRNPLCGRNFEYFSEDPLLSGRMATAITLGVQQAPGAGTTIKHFACNNQEDDRMSSDSIISERALRELYLRNFEIPVKEAQPMSVMTSYNLINGVHSANNPDLCTKVLREEWGFGGLIMTDWTTTAPCGGSQAWKCIEAGNDLIMPGTPDDVDDIRHALADGRLSQEAVDLCVGRIIATVLHSNRFEDAVPYSPDVPL